MNVRFFLDSANLEALNDWKWLVKGVTTNQKIFAKEGIKSIQKMKTRVEKIASVDEIEHVSVQLPLKYDGNKKDYDMIDTIMEIDSKIVLKIPPLRESINYARYIRDMDNYRNVNVTMILDPYQLIFLNHPVFRSSDFLSIFYNRAEEKNEYNNTGNRIHNIEWYDVFGMMDKKMNLLIGSIRKISEISDIYKQLLFLDEEDTVTFTLPPKVLDEIYSSEKVWSMIKEFDGALE